jgi:hypothetical protein
MSKATSAKLNGTARMRAWRGATLAAACGAALAAAAQAASPPVQIGELARITGPSPFRACIADDVPGQEAEGSINYPGSEIEPYIDVNPRRPLNMVSVWQQDRWSDGGARGLVSAVSNDGGRHWATVTPPHFSLCSGGSYERATDPWVTYAANGQVYFQSLSFDFDPDIFGGRHAILVSKSADGGHSWSEPVIQIEDNDPDVFNDKNSMTADPTLARRAFATWDRLELFAASAAQRAALAKAGRDNRILAAGRMMRAMRAAGASAPPEFKGPSYFTRTLDGGGTWERPIIIHDPGANNQTINNLIEVQPDGTLVVFFTEILNLPGGGVRANISLKRSTDHGFSFRPIKGAALAQRIRTLAINNDFGTFTPDDRELVRDAGILFDTAVDRSNGNLYLAWQDSRFSGGEIDEIAFSMSTNSGRTWSPPVKINKTPNRANRFRQAAFVPTIAVNRDGVIMVTYYDFRHDNASGELADHFAVFCNPGASDCNTPASWVRERRLTENSFDILDAPVAGGHFLGDYMGSAAVNRTLHPAFGIADGDDQTSIYTRRVNVAPAGP